MSSFCPLILTQAHSQKHQTHLMMRTLETLLAKRRVAVMWVGRQQRDIDRDRRDVVPFRISFKSGPAPMQHNDLATTTQPMSTDNISQVVRCSNKHQIMPPVRARRLREEEHYARAATAYIVWYVWGIYARGARVRADRV